MDVGALLKIKAQFCLAYFNCARKTRIMTAPSVSTRPRSKIDNTGSYP